MILTNYCQETGAVYVRRILLNTEHRLQAECGFWRGFGEILRAQAEYGISFGAEVAHGE